MYTQYKANIQTDECFLINILYLSLSLPQGAGLVDIRQLCVWEVPALPRKSLRSAALLARRYNQQELGSRERERRLYPRAVLHRGSPERR